MKTYNEKLSDPRWQRKRLEVMSAARWRCELCGDDSQSLHVHHLGYERGKEPWEHSALTCLCKHHHNYAHGIANDEPEKSTTLLGWRKAEALRHAGGLRYVDPFPYIVELDAARGNADAIALIAMWRNAA